MKKKFKAIATVLMVLSVGMTVVSSCVTDPDSSGLEYMPDMYRSPAIEPYVDYGHIQGEEHKELKTQQSALRPPHMTIPYFGTDSAKVAMMLPYHREASSAANTTHGLFESEGWRLSDSVNTEYENAKADKNPIRLTPENIDMIMDEGERIYESKCQHCHGEEGDGQGQMMINKTFVGVPDYKNLQDLGDGQVFYSIYYGKGAMGAHSMLLDKEEIWTLVHYVNQFRFEDYGNFDMKEEPVADSLSTEEVSDSLEVE